MTRCAYCHGGGELGNCTFCNATHHVECYAENFGCCAACGQGDEPFELKTTQGCFTPCCCFMVSMFWLSILAFIIERLQ